MTAHAVNLMGFPFRDVFEKDERLMAGIISGTSVDAVDVAVARLRGSGDSLTVHTIGAAAAPIPDEIRRLLDANMVPETSSVRDITLLNVRLAQHYETAVREAMSRLGLELSALDAIGLHGQTMFHHPDTAFIAGTPVSGTMQLGDPSVLANLLGIPVVGDFRLADMALGGQGAPLVPYFDYVCFRDRTEGRLLLNLGGIANITVLPPNCRMQDVRAFDTGPANRVIDLLAEKLLGQPYDDGGQMALKGTCHTGLLADLLDEPWFLRPPPKSTGRELFSDPFCDRLIAHGRILSISDEDLFATAVALTVRTIADGWLRYVAPDVTIDRMIVAGGGVHNVAVMSGLKKEFANILVETTAAYGIDPDAKEALCFAVLAHETLNGVNTNVPSATGARAATILGKICIPGTTH